MTQLDLTFTPLVKPTAKPGSIQDKFLSFHEANPHVYKNLVSMARKLKSKGIKKIGIGMLFESLRWHYLLETDDPESDYKLNNNYRSRYARLIMSTEDDLFGIFNLRNLTA